MASHKPQPYRSLGNGSAMICFLESKDYVDCIKLAISLGGDADTLAAIAGPMAYAYYKKMPNALVTQNPSLRS